MGFPAIEMAGNVALLASGVGAGFEPLVANLENAVNPLLQSVGTAQPITSTLMTVYATIIGVLTTLKSTPGLPAATLAQIDEYITAAQSATAAYVQAESGLQSCQLHTGNAQSMTNELILAGIIGALLSLLAAKISEDKALAKRVAALESKMNDIHPDLNYVPLSRICVERRSRTACQSTQSPSDLLLGFCVAGGSLCG